MLANHLFPRYTDAPDPLSRRSLPPHHWPTKTFYFFARRNKLRGTICFLGGILFVFLKWPAIGVLMEMFGFLNLFGF
ncbi:hypothetical protein BGW80DRAFT_1323848 [Lactifluus volemus]|nr:hypothetical protein BGW80DRAFT_1323343 [Lactifluus volemus]KAH9971108.1 hypothetical protein BGW80DRAFT_1323848 [Lactifluus volemus]